jgi:uncharacterized membrane protein YfcA
VPPAPATLAHYQLAHADHRAEVQLSWDRARFFLALNAALLVAGSAIATASPRAALAPLALGVVLSVIGALIVARSHGRTRRTRTRSSRLPANSASTGPRSPAASARCTASRGARGIGS